MIAKMNVQNPVPILGMLFYLLISWNGVSHILNTSLVLRARFIHETIRLMEVWRVGLHSSKVVALTEI